MAVHHRVGKAKHKGEQSAIDFLVKKLPDHYFVVSNVDLPTGRPGRTLEHDAVVVAPHAIFTVEMKSWGGLITGNRDRWKLDDGKWVTAPINLTLDKARVLKGQLQTKSGALRKAWVQGIVFVSAPDATVSLTAGYEDIVCTRDDLIESLTDPSVWNLSEKWLSPQELKDAREYLCDGQPPSARTHFGEYEIRERLPAEDRPYDAYRVRTQLGAHRLLHVYPTFGSTETERNRSRDQAYREATFAEKVSGHPNILGWYGLHTLADDDALLLVFEDVSSLLPLEAWAEGQRPGLEAKLKVARAAASALDAMHLAQVAHRRVAPETILVSEDGKTVRVTALDLARDLTGSLMTVTASRLHDPSYRCMAPELLKGATASVSSDLFAFGVVLAELVLERRLFEKAEDTLRAFEPPALGPGAPEELEALVGRLLAVSPGDRPESFAEVVDVLDDVLALGKQAKKAPTPVVREDATFKDFRLTKKIAEGAGGATWRVHHVHEEVDYVAKIALGDQASYLHVEKDVLRELGHPNVVRYKDITSITDIGLMLVVHLVDGVTGEEQAGAGDPLDAARLLRLGEGLFAGLGALHDKGILHRDLKPANVMLEGDLTPVIIDFGLAAPVGDSTLTVGTVDYKDPGLYERGAWDAAMDLFAAWIVLYEVTTGEHPFGGRPQPGQLPAIATHLFPDELDEARKSALAEVFEAALSPNVEARPATAAEAGARLRAVLAPQPQAELDLGAKPQDAPKPPLEPGLLPAGVEASAAIAAIEPHLSPRAFRALRRLNVLEVGAIASLDPLAFERMRNVGRKTKEELHDLIGEAQSRFPEHAKAKAAAGEERPRPRLFPNLVGDQRPLDELGRVLTPAASLQLRRQGAATIGDLAAMDPAAVLGLKGVGQKKLGEIRSKLELLAGEAPRPTSLEHLDLELEAELGASAFGMLSLLLGLRDGEVRARAQVAERLGVTRQAIEQQVGDLEDLRKEASAARALVEAVERILPAAGVARIGALPEALAAQLAAGAVSAEGHLRLAALLLEPGRRLTGHEQLELVCRAPWTPEVVKHLTKTLAAEIAWPPLAPARAAEIVWAALDTVPGDEASGPSAPAGEGTPAEAASGAGLGSGRAVKGDLRRRGVDAKAVLDAVRPLLPDVLTTRDGALFVPPVPFADALAHFRPELGAEPIELEALEHRLQRAYGAVEPIADLDAALEQAGLRQAEDGRIVDAGAPAAKAPELPKLDPHVAKHLVHTPEGTLDLEILVAAAERGGFRVAVMPPENHHRLVDELARSLKRTLGDERVGVVDVDRRLLDALEEADLWEDAEFFDKKGEAADWTWARETLEAALEQALADASGPGRVTLLARPALLGHFDLLDWLSGFYDRVRGGDRGLFVFALPGGIHDGRVRLNEKHPFPYTPDMAAVSLLQTRGGA